MGFNSGFKGLNILVVWGYATKEVETKQNVN